MYKLHYTPKQFTCVCCGQTKSESEFYKQSITGLPSKQCKQCVSLKRSVQRNKRRHNKFVSKEKCRTGEIPALSLADWRDVYVRFEGSCAYCGTKEGRAKAEKLDRDHLVPVSAGGKTTRGNIIPACRKCNRGRGNREWKAWYRAQPFYSVEKENKITTWEEENAATDDSEGDGTPGANGA